MKREELLAEARKHVWAAWQLSAEELASQAVVTLHDMGMLVPEGTAPQLEKLAEQVVALQTELAEAVRAAAGAVRERDLMRERVSEPFGCAHCGEVKRSHGRRYIGGVGMHGWERPSDEQVKDRMLARRAASMALPSNLSLWEEPAATKALRARVAELEAAQESPLAFAEKLDAKSLDNFLIALASATEHEPQDAAIARIHELIASYREAAAPYKSRPLPPRDAVCARPGCGHPGVEHHHGDTRCWARLPKPLGAPVTNCDCTSFVAEGGDAR